MGVSNLDPGAHERRPWNVGSLLDANPMAPDVAATCWLVQS
jgi:hypothetical protein